MQSVSRVERKREAARHRLIAAAASLISQKGVDGLRLRELTERADIGFGSFYNHFQSKEELVEAVVADHVGAYTEAIIVTALERDDPAETTAVAHRLFLSLARDDPQLAWLLVNIDHGEAVLEAAALPRFGPVLERGLELGRFHGIDVQVMVSFIVGATIAVMRGILDGRLGPDADEASARTLLRACGLADAEAAELAARAAAPLTSAPARAVGSSA
jgi:AcrR family transcriptional regulator